MRATPDEIGRRLRERDRAAAPAALNLIEDRTPRGREATAELLAELSPSALGGEAPAHLIGVTGPPGAGKSSLLSCLVRRLARARAAPSPCSPWTRPRSAPAARSSATAPASSTIRTTTAC